MKVQSVSNPQWLDVQHSGIRSDVVFEMPTNLKHLKTPEYRTVNGYIARATDFDASLWQMLSAGLYGKIAEPAE